MKVSKVLSNNLLEGITDTYNIMYGKHCLYDEENNRYSFDAFSFGVIDVLIFPLAASAMEAWGFQKDRKTNEQGNPIRTIVGALGVGLRYARMLTASALTALTLPLICLVHVIKSPYVMHLESKLTAIKGAKINAYTCREVIKPKTNLKEYMEQTKTKTNELVIDNDFGEIASFSLENTKGERKVPYRLFQPSIEDNTKQALDEAKYAARMLGLMHSSSD